MDSRYAAEKWIRNNIPAGAMIEVQGVQERYLPHILSEYHVVVKGAANEQRGPESTSEDVSAELVSQRNPDFILLGSLGNRADPENWHGERLLTYRKKLFGGELGYKVIARFETPSWLPSPRLTGTRPTFVLFGKSL
jgi:hypothetical protein